MEIIRELFLETGLPYLDWRMLVMWAVVGILLYLAVAKKFEPLLLVPIAFGALLANLPTDGLVNRPAGEVYSPVSGKVIYVGVVDGEAIQLPKVLPARPELLTDLDAADIRAVIADESLRQGRGRGSLLAVVRRDDTVAAESLVTVNLGDRQLQLHPTDYLVWADSSGTVANLQVSEGENVRFGQSLLRVYDTHGGGLFYYIQLGIVLELFPPLIFLGVGALTDFGPLIANPRMLLLGAAAQFGVFATFFGAKFFGFSSQAAGAIGIIGGADGPTSIFLANKLAPELLAPIAVAAYSYMALVPVLQPPIMRALTTQAERKIRMQSLRKVSRVEKLVFALVVTISCILLVPAAAPLIGMLMLGNFLRECGVTERLSKSAQNELINIVTIFLGTSVGITMAGASFLHLQTVKIMGLGVVAFAFATAAGVLMAKGMNLISKNKINPLIGSAGVSAVPMAARVSQVEGQKADPSNFLLMHAMGPNVAGVIGTAVVAGYLLAVLN